MISGVSEKSQDTVSAKKTIDDLHKEAADFKKKYLQSDREEKRLSIENKILREEVALLKQKLFGKKSERQVMEDEEDPVPQSLFPIEEGSRDAEDSPKKDDDTVTIGEHKRKKAGRKPLPGDLPRVEVVHDIPESEKQCGCGDKLKVIGKEVTERLEIIPSLFWVSRHVRLKYACGNCEGLEDEGHSVKLASPPPQMIPKSYASQSLLAHILVGKYCDALPFYRQEKMFSRAGLDLGRGNMSRWAMEISKRIQPLMDRLISTIKSGPLINMDETRVQVLKESGRDPTRLSYMWVARGGNRDHPAILFRYSPDRNTRTAKEFVGDYRGCVQTDGYKAYNFLDQKSGVIHAGCWAHARRKFKEVTYIASKNKKKPDRKEILANNALRIIRKLYDFEREAKKLDLTGKDLLDFREEKSKPLCEEFEKWLLKYQPRIPRDLLLGKAIHYTLNQWKRLTKFITHSEVGLDNNQVENAIRPFAVGRKNWLFSDSVKGANGSAAIYSLIETAKANDLDPFWYLYYLFERIPRIQSEREYDDLMPCNIDKDLVKEFTAMKKSQTVAFGKK